MADERTMNYGDDIMLFHSFKSENERNKCGSSFIEIQLCRMPLQTEINDIISVSNIQHGDNDSLYIYSDDDVTFYDEYSYIFNCGIYNNLETGIVDLYGINYYVPNDIDAFIRKLGEEKPLDYEILSEWLLKSKVYNGFYILGL